MSTMTRADLPYAEIFLKQVNNGLELAIGRIEGAAALEESWREHALTVLHLGLKQTGAWAKTRKLLFHLAPLMEKAGWREDWIPFLELGLERAKTVQDVEAIGELNYQLGVLCRLMAEYDRAAPHYRDSAAAFAALGEHDRQARSLNRWAYAAVTISAQTALAETLVSEVERLSDSAEERGYAQMVRGLIANRKGDFPRALQAFLRSLSQWERISNLRMVAWGLVNLAFIYTNTEEYSAAKSALERALTLFEEVYDPTARASAMMNLGVTHYHLGDARQALAYYAQVLPTVKRTNRGHGLGALYNAIGKAYTRLGDYEKAHEAYQLALKTFQGSGDVGEQVNVMANTAELIAEEGERAAAIALLKEGLELLRQHPGTSGYDYWHKMLETDLATLKEGGDESPPSTMG